MLHVASAAMADVPTGGNFPLGTTVCQQGCRARLDGDGIALAPGRYEVTGAVVLKPATEQATAVGLSASVLVGGSPVQGGSASIASTGVVTLPVATTVSVPCGGSTLVVRNVGADASVSSVSIIVRPAA